MPLENEWKDHETFHAAVKTYTEWNERSKHFKSLLFSSPLWRLCSCRTFTGSCWWKPPDRGVLLVASPFCIKDGEKVKSPTPAVLWVTHNSVWAPAAMCKRCLFCAKSISPIAVNTLSLDVLACHLPRQAQVGTARAACQGRDEGFSSLTGTKKHTSEY